MAIRSMSLWGRAAFVSVTCIATGGCVSDFVGPVAVVSHRYAIPAHDAPKTRPIPAEVDVSSAGSSDRVPTPVEIFNFHPRGSAENDWRQPFVINPSEGPLKIRHWSAAEFADNAPPIHKGENAVAAGQRRPLPGAPVTLVKSARPAGAGAPAATDHGDAAQ